MSNEIIFLDSPNLGKFFVGIDRRCGFWARPSETMGSSPNLNQSFSKVRDDQKKKGRKRMKELPSTTTGTNLLAANFSSVQLVTRYLSARFLNVIRDCAQISQFSSTKPA